MRLFDRSTYKLAKSIWLSISGKLFLYCERQTDKPKSICIWKFPFKVCQKIYIIPKPCENSKFSPLFADNMSWWWYKTSDVLWTFVFASYVHFRGFWSLKNRWLEYQSPYVESDETWNVSTNNGNDTIHIGKSINPSLT